MTNTPRTEDAWRDATMGSRKGDWEFVARTMYACAQELEDLPQEHKVELGQAKNTIRFNQERIASLREQVEALKQKITDAKEALT